MRFSTILLSLSISGFAAQSIWNDSVNGSAWNFANHWSLPGIPGSADTAVFNTIGPSVSDQFKISIIAPVTVGSIEFNNRNSNTGYWIFGAVPLHLNASPGNSTILITQETLSQTLFDTPIILGKDLNMINKSARKIIFNQSISGRQGVNIKGLVELSGLTPNTYTETTKVQNGTLFLNKAKGVNAVAGNLLLNSGVVELLNDFQIAQNSSVVLEGNSTLNIGSHHEKISQLQLEKSLVKIGTGGSLSIMETLELTDQSSVEGLGTLCLTGANAKISFLGFSQQSHIDTAVHLGNQMRAIAVNSNPSFTINGPISDGGITKTGKGILNINSNANLSGLVIVEGGIHLNGNVASQNAVQIAPDGFLYGKGTIVGNLVVQGTITPGVAISQGTTPNIVDYFSFDKTYTNEAPKQLLFLTGDFLSPNSLNGIHVDGDILFSPQSTLVIKFSPDSQSNIDTKGRIVLDSPSIIVSPTVGFYQLDQKHDILYAGTLQGQVGTVTSSYAMLRPNVTYIAGEDYSGISFSLALNRFSDLLPNGNATFVGAYLDSLHTDPSDNSPIIIEALVNIPTIDAITDALNQLHPSAFTSLSVVQEDDLFYIRNAIFNRLYQDQFSCFCNDCECFPLHIWGGVFGGSTKQDNQNGEIGYHAQTPGAILGVDAYVRENTIFGGSIGYTYTFHEWRSSRGDAKMQTIYGSLYSLKANPCSFFAANATFGYSFYDVNRKINIGPGSIMHATAHSDFGGFTGSLDLKMGAHFQVQSTKISPFLGLDYMIVQQNKFEEKGARILNLKVKSHVSDLLASEAGFEFNFEHWKDQTFLQIMLRLSAIGESRFFGRYERASFATGSSFKVKGLYPCRILGALGIGISAAFDRSTVSLSYQGKSNWQFTDQSIILEYLWRF